MEDTAIVELFWSRDTAAVSAAQEKYGALCLGIAKRFTGSDQDAEECLSDALLRLWSSIPPERPGSLRAYMAKITRNLSIDRWRQSKTRRESEVTGLADELADCLAPVPGPEKAAEDREITACLTRWLRSLSREDRTLFVRRYWYGDTVAELAKGRGVPANRLAQRLRRLRGALGRALEKEGITL